MKCERFCNGHCCTSDCPNIRCDEFEEYYDIPASDAGYERVECKDCIYDDQHCDCDDCYINGSEYCPKNGEKRMAKLIAIKGFRMPETCISCPMQVGGWCGVAPPEVDERVAATVDEAWQQKRPQWCPLIEVETTEMDGGDSNG